MAVASKTEAVRYFSGFHRQMGRRQVLPHLTQPPRWWSLRDSNGRTPLMRVLITVGFTFDMLSQLIHEEPEVARTLDAVDRGGKNLWWHLLYHHGYRNSGHEWVPLLRDRVALQASTRTGRGIFIDHIQLSLGRQWAGFFPREQFGRMVYALPNNTHATWWHCNHDEASAIAKWLLGVRVHNGEIARSIIRCLDQCERVDPKGRIQLPMPMQGALMLLDALHGSAARTEQAMEDGAHVFVGAKERTRLMRELKERPRIMHARFLEVLAYNDEACLSHHTPKAHGASRVLRL